MSARTTRRQFGHTLALGAAGAALAACTPTSTHERPMNEHTPSSPTRQPITSRMPVGFVGHGAPLLALDAAKGAPLRAWGAALPIPRAVLVISAHWERSPTTIGTTETRPLVYDFGGFPQALYEVQYAAPGAPWLADRIDSLFGAPSLRSPRGLDHGVWTPLVHLFADATVPVLQLSMPSSEGARALFDLGRRLAPLRDEGVFVLGSGNITHNLRAADFAGNSAPPAWAADFDEWARSTIARRDWDTLLDYASKAPSYRTSHPTDDHWFPMIVAAGASADATTTRFPVEGWEFGSFSRRAVELA